MAVEGTDLPLWGMEIDPEEAKEEFRASLASDGGEGAKGFMQGMGLGMVVEQLADLKLGELLDTPPPGLDESVAIAKVCYCNRMYLSWGVGGAKVKEGFLTICLYWTTRRSVVAFNCRASLPM